MSLVKFAARNHRQQVQRNGVDDSVDDRATTWELFDKIAADWGPFTIDVAAAEHNTKCERYFDRQVDGLGQPWDDERVWCNPPYSSIEPWVQKAWSGEADLVVMLLPANRTEQEWWQALVEPFRDRQGSPLRVVFLRGRHRFVRGGQRLVEANERPPFGNCLLIWRYVSPELPPRLGWDQ